MDAVEKKLWKKLKYRDPRRGVLVYWFRQVVSELPNVPAKIRDWRVRALRKYSEEKQAALFCYGMNKCFPDQNLEYAMPQAAKELKLRDENRDYDCVMRRKPSDAEDYQYLPLQLKEVVSDEINPFSSVEAELQKLIFRYPKSRNLVVALWVNRDGEIDFDRLVIPKLGILDLRLFGYTSSSGL